MNSVAALSETARAIQLSIAPVFLLAGIGAFMNVIASRLARVVDRARVLELEHDAAGGADHPRWIAELRMLESRMTLASKSIYLCTASGLAVCALVIMLFVGEVIAFDLGRVIAVLFVVAVSLLGAGMVLFLAETRIAVRSLHVRGDLLETTKR